MRHLIFLLAVFAAGAAHAQAISSLPAGTALTGVEPAPFVQGGATVKITADQLNTFITTAMEAAAHTWALDQSVPDDAYNTGTWDANFEVPTKNAVRDAIETLVVSGVSDGDKGDITVSSSGTVWDIDSDAVVAGSTPLITLQGTSAGALGPVFKLQHDSSSPAASDIASSIRTHAGTDDEEVGRIDYRLTNGATTAEEGIFDIYTDVAGVTRRQMGIGGGFPGFATAAAVVIGEPVAPLTEIVTGDEHTPALQVIGADASGGHHNSAMLIWRSGATSFNPKLMLGKSRGVTADYTIVQNGDALGTVGYLGANGSSADTAAEIYAFVEGTPGAVNDMPGRIVFATTADGSGGPIARWSVTNAGRMIGPLASSSISAQGSYGGSFSPAIQALGLTIENSSIGGNYFANNAAGPRWMLGKSRGATVGSYTIAADGDEIGAIVFNGSDGTDFAAGAEIFAGVDGTPAADSVPGRITFATNAVGGAGPTSRWRINSSGVLTGPSASTAQTNGAITPAIQLLGSTVSTSTIMAANVANNANGGHFYLSKTRGGGVGTYTVVQVDDEIGSFAFFGADGTDLAAGAEIITNVDGTPGSGDMPGRISFSTSLDGAESPTARLVIKNDGGVIIGSNDTSPGTNSLNVDNRGILKISEAEAGGDNFKGFRSPAAVSADTTCDFEDDANFIPDSCVGDGSDASDARLKSGFQLAKPNAVGSMIDQIKVYDFKWNADAPNIAEMVRKGNHGFGVKAQELYKINPELVHVGGADALKDPWTWRPERLVPYLLVEIQSLRARVAELEAR